MGILSFLKREDADAAYQAGADYGKALAKIEPGLKGVALAQHQVAACDLAEKAGMTENEVEAFDAGMWLSYTGKVYCGECRGYYLPHEH